MKKTLALLTLMFSLIFHATAQDSDILVLGITSMCVDEFDETAQEYEDNPWQKAYGSFVIDDNKGQAILHMDSKEYKYYYVGKGDDEGEYYYVGEDGEKITFRFEFKEEENHLYLFYGSTRIAFVITI